MYREPTGQEKRHKNTKVEQHEEGLNTKLRKIGG